MAGTHRGRTSASVRTVSAFLFLFAAAALAALAAVGGPGGVSAQAPDLSFRLPDDTPVAGDDCPLPPGGDPILLGDPPRLQVDVVVLKPPLPVENGIPYPNRDPSLCPRLKPPYPLGSRTLVQALGFPAGVQGVYEWDFGAGGASAWYQSTALGTKQVGVTLTAAGQQAQDTSGYIHVFDAELTFEGGSADPQDDEEDNPGFFMAVGGPRKLLTMSLSPANPHDLMPDGFLHALETRPAPPPYQVSLSGYPHVAFYTQAVGGDPLAETNWGWKETGPNEFTESPAPEQVYVEAVSPGNQNVGFGLNIAAPAELIFWEGAPAEAQDWVKVTVLNLLTAWDLDGLVADEDEDDPGAFIHFNVDNDNASDNKVGGAKHPGGDYLETGPVAGENDLKGVKMCVGSATPVQGVMTLSRSAGIRVWKSGTKGAAHAVLVGVDQKSWDLSDADERNAFNAVKNDLFVEGVAGGSASLQLTYAPPGGQAPISDTIHYTCIAADCGNQPLTGRRQFFQAAFPGSLKHCEWSITGNASSQYNCISYSVGITDYYYAGHESVCRGR